MNPFKSQCGLNSSNGVSRSLEVLTHAEPRADLSTATIRKTDSINSRGDLSEGLTVEPQNLKMNPQSDNSKLSAKITLGLILLYNMYILLSSDNARDRIVSLQFMLMCFSILTLHLKEH